MNITYKFLENVSLEEVHKSWQEGFADYATDMTYMTVDVMRHRQAADKIDYKYSVGAYDENKLIGILLIGVDKIDGELCAWDGGTAVIKKYRGQGVASRMFDKCAELLKYTGIKRFILEVYQDNTPAVNTYKKAGFEVSREFACYDFKHEHFKNGIDSLPGIEIRTITFEELNNNWALQNYNPGWEHRLNSIEAVKDEVVIDGAFINGQCAGFIVYSPIIHWIAGLGFKPEIDNLDNLLLTNLINKTKDNAPYLRYDNLEADNKLIKTIESVGFSVAVNQYEMICEM